ncbi:SusD/RagB family nutrient-binding outer membrane lipoprotein [Sphingobacterium hungaricum]
MKFFNRTGFFLILILPYLISCDQGFEELNTNPTTTTKAYPSQFLPSALVNSLTYNLIRNRDFNNELMQVTVNASDADGRVFRYDFSPSWSDYLWNGHYTNLTNYKDMYAKAIDPVSFNKAYQGISLILQCWTYSILTDTYGDIPYFKSNLGRDSLLNEPPFDPQMDIYLDMFEKLDSANTLLSSLSATDTVVDSMDPVYAGNESKWRKLGNSLLLRMLLRVSGKPEIQEQIAPFIQKLLVTNTANYPIFTSNDDSAVLRWTGTGGYVSPLMTVREQDYSIPICSFFIDFLRNTNDPRINTATYGTSGINRWGIAASSGNYIGIASGYPALGSDPTRLSYFYAYNDNGGVNSMQKEPLTGIIMNYAELQFIKAEAAVHGWISGTAESYFYSGAENSIKFWLSNFSTPIKDHLIASDVGWDENATVEEKLERIHQQKYYALLFCDLQQWFEYRRTSHPILPKGDGLENNGEMPARMVYPIYIQSSNPTNYKLAVDRQGPDEINTKVWWQTQTN